MITQIFLPIRHELAKLRLKYIANLLSKSCTLVLVRYLYASHHVDSELVISQYVPIIKYKLYKTLSAKGTFLRRKAIDQVKGRIITDASVNFSSDSM